MREEAFELLEKMPEDKLVFIIQIMQGVNSLYNSGAVAVSYTHLTLPTKLEV